MLDPTHGPRPSRPPRRFFGRPLRSRPPLVPRHFVIAGAVWLFVALPRPARGGSLDALDPFDPVASDAWQGPLVPTALYGPAEAPAHRGGPWLGVGGGFQGSPGVRNRFFALVELGIPLDDLAGAGAAAFMIADDDADGLAGEARFGPEAAFPEAERSAGPRNPGIRTGLDAPATSPGLRGDGSDATARSASADAAGSSSRPTLAIGAGLPGRAAPEATPMMLPGCTDARSCDPAALMPLARAAVAEALRVQGGQAELRRLDGMAARSRAAASLPEVRLGAGTSRDESLRLTPTAADPARFTRDGGRDSWLEARLTWRLESAIFARDEIAIMRLRAQQREHRAGLASEVLEALVAFERARLRLASDLATSDERDQAEIVQFGALARLDVLTDGWFSRQLSEARKKRRDGGGAGARAPEPGWP